MANKRLVRGCSLSILGVLAMLVLVCPVSGAADGGGTLGRPRMADSLWIEDLDYLARELPKRHKNLFFQLPETEFNTMVGDLKESIPSKSDYEIVVGIMRILASVGDPHTQAGIAFTNFFSRLPLVMKWYAEGLFVVETAPELEGLLGRRVVSIDGRGTAEVHSRLTEVIPHQNPALLKTRGPRHMVFPEILAALGAAEDPDTLVFGLAHGEPIAVAAVPLKSKFQRITVFDRLECEVPLYLRNPDRYYWFTYLEDSAVLYIKYDSCTEMADEPIEAFTRRVLAALDSLRVEKLVFDMRDNGGGNSALAGPLISGILARPDINRRGSLFVVVGPATFSSAILNTLELMEGGNAIVVGEPTGGKPNSYGEVRFFLLPNSMLPIQYSTKYFDCLPEDLPSIPPDIDVEISFEDFLSCRDPVLDAILDYRAP